MIGAGAVQTIPIARFANADALLSLLSGGGGVSGRVVAEGPGLALALPNARLPLPEGVALPPGTPVRVQVVGRGDARQIQIQPQAQSQPSMATNSPAGPSPQVTLAVVLAELAPVLAQPVTAEQAAVLTPVAGGLAPEHIRAVIELLVGRERVGVSLAQLSEAIEGTKLPAGVRDRIASLIQWTMAETAAEFERAIASARASLRGRSGAGRTAGLESILDEIVSLRQDIASLRDAAGSGADRILRQLDALVERFDAGRLQNVCGFELPYQFMELPLSRATGFEQAHIHVFGEASKNHAGENAPYSFVLDLELSQLGALWIHLRGVGDSCACVIRATSDRAVGAIDAAAPSLTEALTAAGYAEAQVRAEAWDGDRVAALVAMSGRFSGFEAQA